MPKSIPEKARELRAILDRGGMPTLHLPGPRGTDHRITIYRPDGETFGVWIGDGYRLWGIDGMSTKTNHTDVFEAMAEVRSIWRGYLTRGEEEA
jgi:hypothetical protein